MHVTGVHQFDYRTFRRVTVDAFPRRRLTQWTGGVGFALCVLTFAYRGFTVDDLPLFGASLLMLGLPDLLAFVSWLPQRQEMGEPIHYKIDETEVQVRTATSETRLAWSGPVSVTSNPSAWLVKRGVVRTPILRAAFSPEDQATIDAFVRGLPAVSSPGRR